MKLCEKLRQAWKEFTTQEVDLPSNSSYEEREGIPVESFYVAGYGGWGFNYVEGLYAKADDIGLKHDVLVMTPNTHGANTAGVVRVEEVERKDDYVRMLVGKVSQGQVKKVLKKLGVPKSME